MLREVIGSHRERKNEMTKAREKSDERVVPEDHRKVVPTEVVDRGGKALTRHEQAGQLGLRFGTADSPQGVDVGAAMGQPMPAPHAMPKPKHTKSTRLRPMLLEEVAEEDNLRNAFNRVALNDGAAGPDGKSVSEVRKHLASVIAMLHRTLLKGSYKPGEIRRVWIPKASGGKRGWEFPT